MGDGTLCSYRPTITLVNGSEVFSPTFAKFAECLIDETVEEGEGAGWFTSTRRCGSVPHLIRGMYFSSLQM